MQVNMHEAKSQLSKLGEAAWQGEDVVIAKAGKPYLDLVPHNETNKPRIPGQYKDEIKLGDDFNAESTEINNLFAGEE